MSLGSLGCALGVVGFTTVAGFLKCTLRMARVISGCSAHWGEPWGLSGSFGVIGAPWGSSATSGVVGFIKVCPGGRRIRPWSLSSLECTLGFIGFIKGRWVR